MIYFRVNSGMPVMTVDSKSFATYKKYIDLRCSKGAGCSIRGRGLYENGAWLHTKHISMRALVHLNYDPHSSNYSIRCNSLVSLMAPILYYTMT